MAKAKIAKDIGRNQRVKLKRKINIAARKGKLKKHQRDQIAKIQEKKTANSRKKFQEVCDDYQHERSYKKEQDGKVSDDEYERMDVDKNDTVVIDSDEEVEDPLPLDMLDDDVDWENSAFFTKKHKGLSKELDEERNEVRRFKTDLAEDEQEMLPIKVDGKVVKRVMKIKVEEDDEDFKDIKPDVEKKEDDYSQLSAAQLLFKRKELLEESKKDIAKMCISITADPEHNVTKFRKLLDMAVGQGVHSLIRESTQKLALASLSKAFIEAAPGYSIRSLTEVEKKQSMTKDTKVLYRFEESLLLYYLKYLKLLEKNCRIFLTRGKTYDESTFSHKIGMISVKAMVQLINKLSHFNYATNVVSYLSRLATSAYHPVVIEACAGIATLLKEDIVFRMSLHAVKSIATLVNQKSCYVTPELLETFLSLKIKEIDKDNRAKEKHQIKVRKSQVLKERKSKSAKKFQHQVQQLEHDLKKVQAAESLSTKMRYATETMKHVFATYFRVMKRMPTTKLLEPVLAGLSKFAHLINVEFFDDLIFCLEEIVEMQHLRVTDSLHCIKTIFVILSGEGQAINIDPYRFYKSMYALLPSIPFQKDHAQEVEIIVECIDIMLNRRKKQVSIGRVAAFVKRLLAISFLLSTRECVAIIACVRTIFLNHQRLKSLIEDDSDAVTNGIFRPDVIDPDTCNALSSSALPELNKLLKYPERAVGMFAANILAGLPSTGEKRLPAEWMTIIPKDWLHLDIVKSDRPSPFFESITKAAKKKKQSLTSKNLCSTVNDWLM
jgi:nucleolar complex protein 3